ncbi:hypothetical protein [Frankia sp. Cppng1_Ct_nod]|uniref:hypothetical protein n=1 Tax=Frankia sp. Cppng1_Ct_nod TaxID=2897162 RepID=UPI001041A30B|nr:hypothetical protein [Frankia sp. Cppng1_Ct_nod]
MTGQASTDVVGAVTRLETAFTAGGGASVICHRYPDRTPILSVFSGPVGVTIAVSSGGVGAAALAFARDLADAVGVFLAECERFTTTDAADNSADDPAGGTVVAA